MGSRSVLCLLGVMIAASAARAEGQFQVDPTVVDLAPGAQSGAIVVTNHGKAPVRLQAQMFTWSENLDGGMVLAPTTKVVVRPALLEVPAGGSRTLRVGSLAQAEPAEQSFRMFVEELPDRSAAQPAGVRVLTRIGVPVFVAPVQRSQTITVAATPTTVEVVNAGTLHVKLGAVELRAQTAAGAARWRHKASGWYVLPGTTRRFAIELGADACRSGESLIAVATAETGASWTSAPVPCSH